MSPPALRTVAKVAMLRQRHQRYEVARGRHAARCRGDTRNWGHLREVPGKCQGLTRLKWPDNQAAACLTGIDDQAACVCYMFCSFANFTRLFNSGNIFKWHKAVTTPPTVISP